MDTLEELIRYLRGWDFIWICTRCLPSEYYNVFCFQLCVESAVSDDEAEISGSSVNIRRASSTAAIDYDTEKCNVVEFLASFTPLQSGPFSAIIPSLIPQDFLQHITNSEDSETKYFSRSPFSCKIFYDCLMFQ